MSHRTTAETVTALTDARERLAEIDRLRAELIAVRDGCIPELSAAGYSTREIAEVAGVSAMTVSRVLREYRS